MFSRVQDVRSGILVLLRSSCMLLEVKAIKSISALWKDTSKNINRVVGALKHELVSNFFFFAKHLIFHSAGKLTDMYGRGYCYNADVKHMNSAGVLATLRNHEYYVSRVPQSVLEALKWDWNGTGFTWKSHSALLYQNIPPCLISTTCRDFTPLHTFLF